jgi:hypothetical protein
VGKSPIGAPGLGPDATIRLMPAAVTTFSTQLRSSLPPAACLAAVRRAILGTATTVDEPDHTTLMAKAGSRLRYRLTGGGPLPLVLHFDVHEEDARRSSS